MQDGYRELKALYQGLGYVACFVHARLSHAPYQLVEGLTPKAGRILDLGCGYGIFANYLGLQSPKREVLGIDMAQRKIRFADRGVPNTRFLVGDVTRIELEPCAAVVMNHLLHHLRSLKEQEEVLRRCRQILSPGGRLVICEIDRRPKWKFMVTQVVDHLLYLGNRIWYRSAEEFEALLRAVGFKVDEVIEAHRGVPLSHVVFVATRHE